MKNTVYANMSDNKLLKTRDLIRGVYIGFGIIYVLVLVVLGYLLVTSGLQKISFAVLIPVFTLPVAFLPLLIALTQINKEIKERKG